MDTEVRPPGAVIDVFLADDNLIVREGVRALLEPRRLQVVGTAADYDELVNGGRPASRQVVVTDIRMPPSFQNEGIEAAQEIRKRHPGTGIVILSQFDDPEYAISLLDEGAAGCAYLLKDHVAEGDQLARAVRAVATGGSVLDPTIVESMVHPVTDAGDLSQAEEELLHSWPRAGPSRPSPWPRAPRPRPRGTRWRSSSCIGRRERRRAELAAPTADAARGHRQPRGAGRDVDPAAPRAAWPISSSAGSRPR